MAVSFTESVKPHLTVLQFDYSEHAEFLLASGENLFAGELARRARKVFLSRDAVGLLVDLCVSDRGDSVARLHAAEKIVGPAIG